MIKRHPFLALLLILALMAMACSETGSVSNTVSGSTNQNEAAPQDQVETMTPEEYEAQITQKEAQDWAALQPQIEILPLTEEDKAAIDLALTSDEPISIGQGEINWDGSNLSVNSDLGIIGQGDTAFWVPTLQMAPSTWATLYDPFVKYGDVTLRYQWETYFHWTHHLSNPYNLSANGAWLNSIIRGSMNGGVIYELQGTGAVRHQYLFISNMSANGGPAMRWSTILAENGAPITSFNIGMKGGSYTEKEAERYIAQMLKRGYRPIDPSQLPASIRNTWGGSNNPPIIRYFLWSLAYQVEVMAKMAALSISEAATALVTWAGTTLTTPFFIIIPDVDNFFLPGMTEPIKT